MRGYRVARSHGTEVCPVIDSRNLPLAETAAKRSARLVRELPAQYATVVFTGIVLGLRRGVANKPGAQRIEFLSSSPSD